jgi:uncharacterized cupredoxin-like copper-binding protein
MSGNITSVYPNLKPGDYTCYCGVDGHRAQGMEGTLTIGVAAGRFHAKRPARAS